MRRKFIAKRKKSVSIFFKIIIIFIIGLFILCKIMSFKIFETNTNLVTYIMESSNHLINTNLSNSDKLNDLSLLLTDLDLKNPVTLFLNDYVYNIKKSKETILEEVVYRPLQFTQNLINSLPKLEENEKLEPLVYIYNTHQTEEYIGQSNIPNVVPNVYSAAYILKDLLEQKNINTIVEDGNISAYLQDNSLNYDDSYIASRYYLQPAILNYPSVKIFIDLHRDALTHDLSTIEYDGKSYAKILFVVGLEHENYKQNLDFTNELNDLIVKNYPFLTRGVLTKKGPLVNGVYNQDLGSNVILLEVGGNENTFDEVCNTLELISNILEEKLGDDDV